MHAIAVSALKRPIARSTCACVVTSSAVVGLIADQQLGFLATHCHWRSLPRWRIPPDISRYSLPPRRSGSAKRLFELLQNRAVWAAPRPICGADAWHLGRLGRNAVARPTRTHRFLKDHRNRVTSNGRASFSFERSAKKSTGLPLLKADRSTAHLRCIRQPNAAQTHDSVCPDRFSPQAQRVFACIQRQS